MDPLDIMVEDCWLHLFQFLTAEDKQALCDTCGTFHAMLQPEKVKWGLELVLPDILQEIIQFDSSKEYIQALGSFRLVCKSWKTTFDKYCGNSHYPRIFPFIRRKYDFCNSYESRQKPVTKLEKFLTFFKDHSGNPFIGRTVTLFAVPVEDEEKEVHNDKEHSSVVDKEREDNENESLERERKERILKDRKLLLQLLTKYGKEIDHLKLTNYIVRAGEIEYCDEFNACKLLQLVLANTPNLQSLEIPFGSEHDCTSRFSEKLTEHFTLNPFPRMTRLRKLTFSIQRVNRELVNLLLEAYKENLQWLVVSKAEEISESIWSSMRNLTNLELHNSDFESTVKFLQTLHSPLELIFFEESYDQGRNGTGKVFWIDKFLLAVQHLPLKHVILGLTSKIVKESAPFPRDFPMHQTITYFAIHNLYRLDFISLDFLQFLPQLKSLYAGGVTLII